MPDTKDKNLLVIDLINKTTFAFAYLRTKWFLILAISLLGTAIGYFYAFLQKPQYEGTLTFVLSSESKSGSFSGLASQFGIDLGSNSSSDVFSGDNIITLFNSRKMIRKVIFKKNPESGELLINLLVRELQIDKKWSKNIRYNNLFPFQKEEGTSRIQDSLISSICLLIKTKYLDVSRPDKKLSVYVVSTVSPNEIFSCYLTRMLVDQTAQFYIDTKTSLAKQNLFMLLKEADSLRNLMGSSIVSTASEIDRTFNLNPALQIQRSSIQKSQVNTTVLGTAYSEVIKNLELAKISLQKETPLYQIIDKPDLPLTIIKKNKSLYALISFGLTLFLLIPSLLIRKKILLLNKANYT